ncbi:MAG: hypothetical protein HYY32_07455 [Chloroflexi bacterium]|nr:hypothetical protein [Chloroflexota bacterium]
MSGNTTRLRVHDPTGASGASLSHAPRLDTLAGKTICEISNGMWEYQRVFPALREQLKKRFPTVRIIPYSEVVSGPGHEDLDLVSRLVKEKGCDAVISGMAA